MRTLQQTDGLQINIARIMNYGANSVESDKLTLMYAGSGVVFVAVKTTGYPNIWKINSASLTMVDAYTHNDNNPAVYKPNY